MYSNSNFSARTTDLRNSNDADVITITSYEDTITSYLKKLEK